MGAFELAMLPRLPRRGTLCADTLYWGSDRGCAIDSDHAIIRGISEVPLQSVEDGPMKVTAVKDVMLHRDARPQGFD